jgi:hypothetical protein
MRARITTWLMRLDRRALVGTTAVLVLFVALEGWLLVLRGPLAEWRTLVVRRQASETAAPAAFGAEIERLRGDIARAERALQADPMSGTDDDTVLQLIATFGRLAPRHGVVLGSVKAGGRGVDRDFEQVTFDVEARGAYRALIDWLADSEAQVAPLSVIELTMSAIDEGRQVALKVKFAVYLPMPTGGKGT